MLRTIIICLLAITFAACNKVKIESPEDFDVSASKTTLTIRDTVYFQFQGNPSYITFYSGEANHRYINAARTVAQPDSVILNFATTTTAPSAVTQSASQNYVSVLVSKDFNGQSDVASLKKATWTDISSRAKFATTTTAVASGNVHLEDQMNGASPIYLAFRYIADTAITTSVSRRWVVGPTPAVSIRGFFKDTVNTYAANVNGAGFTNVISVFNLTNTWVYANNMLTFNAPALGSSKDEDWSISRPLLLNTIPSDYGFLVKNIKTIPTGYKYIFKKPGTYTATFVARNIDSKTEATKIKEITFTVTN